jgi:hypothetical protein
MLQRVGKAIFNRLLVARNGAVNPAAALAAVRSC